MQKLAASSDAISNQLRDDERDASPVRGRQAGVGCPVWQDHVMLALGEPRHRPPRRGRERPGVGLRQPSGKLATSEPSQGSSVSLAPV